ncbi:hypothetical protein D9M68_597580 [compost metagenome]
MQRLAEAFHGELGGAVHAPAVIGLVTAQRRDVDDAAGALAAHVRQHRAGNVEQAEDVGRVDALDFGGAGFLHRAEDAVAGVVQQDVDAAEALDALGDRRMGLALAGHVKAHGQQVGVFAQAGDDILGFARGGDHRIAHFERLGGDQGTETTGSTSNEPGTHSNSPVWEPAPRGLSV